jgi:hypothetical protein
VLAVGLAVVAGCGGGGGGGGNTPGSPGPVTPPSLVGPLKDSVVAGTVYATAVASDGTVYVGGRFDRIGPATGSWIAVDATTGARAFASPVVNDQVEVSAPDGAGGMFIAGSFTHVGGVRRDHLAHLLADGSLDPDWVVSVWTVDGVGKPYATAPIAMAYSAHDHRLYLGGSFNSVNGAPRANLASVSATTGAVTSWDPGADSLVEALVPHSDGNVYVAGGFLNVGGAARMYLAAIDSVTGHATTWDPGPGNFVTALAAYGNTLFVQGFFNGFACSPMTPAPRLAALQLDAAIVQSWAPAPNASGFRGGDPLVVSGDTLYVGGDFTELAGTTRSGAAAFDLTGMTPANPPELKAWNPDIAGPTRRILGFATRGADTVYVLGSFSTVGGQPRPGLAAVDTTTGAVTPWNPSGGGYTAEVRGNTVWVAAWPEWQVRHNLASFGADGKLTTWDPDVNGTVRALALSGSTLYAGGEFTAVGGGTSRDKLASFTIPAGTLTSWNPGVWGRVLALAASGDTIYAGGDFNAVRASPAAPSWDPSRTNLVAFDPSGLATFNAVTNAVTQGAVRTLLVRDGQLFVGGAFSKLGPSTLALGQRATRWNLGAVDALTGETTPFDPNMSSAVNALALGGGVLYAGGEFYTVNSPAVIRKNVAAFDPDGTGTALAFSVTVAPSTVWPYSQNPSPVTALAVNGNTVYVGGEFYVAEGQPHAAVAAYAADTAAVQSWDPGLTGGTPRYLGFRGPWLVVGGSVAPPAGRVGQGVFEVTR